MCTVPKVCVNKLQRLGAIRKSRVPKAAGGHLFEFGHQNNKVLMDQPLSFQLIDSA
jgi:hypothetical protein